MKVYELSQMCSERGLKKSGTKSQLVERLKNNKSDTHPLYSMKINELKDMCKNNSLRVAGNKKELIERLQHNVYSNNNNLIIETSKEEETISTDDWIMLFIRKMIKIENNFYNK